MSCRDQVLENAVKKGHGTKKLVSLVSKIRLLAEGYVRREGNCNNPLILLASECITTIFPFPCTAFDKLLVRIANAITTTGRSMTFACTNSNGGRCSGFQWVARIVDISIRCSFANAMEEENDAEPGPREGGMREDDGEEVFLFGPGSI